MNQILLFTLIYPGRFMMVSPLKLFILTPEEYFMVNPVRCIFTIKLVSTLLFLSTFQNMSDRYFFIVLTFKYIIVCCVFFFVGIILNIIMKSNKVNKVYYYIKSYYSKGIDLYKCKTYSKIITIFYLLDGFNLLIDNMYNIFGIFKNIIFILLFNVIITALACHKILKLYKEHHNIHNYIKIRGLSYSIDKVIFVGNYYKFIGSILIPTIIFIYRIYSTISLLQFSIILLIFLVIYIILISNNVIEIMYNLVVNINKVKELLIECLQFVFSKKDNNSIINNSFKINKCYNKTNTMNFIRKYSTKINNNKLSGELIKENSDLPKGWQYLTLQNINIFNIKEFNLAFDKFWSLVMINLPDSKTIGLLVKIKDPNGVIKTIGPLCKINALNDRAELRTTLWHYIANKGDNYNDFTVSSIIFQYIYLKKMKTVIQKIELKKEVDYSSGAYNYPLSTDLNKWGTIIYKKGNKSTIVNDKYEGTQIKVTTFSDKQVYKICVTRKVILTVIDFLGANQDSFTRVINNQTFVISNGEMIFKTAKRKTRFISKVKKDKLLRNRFLTFDIETRKINGVHSPYCISFYDGEISWSFYLSDFKSIDDMMKTAFRSIMIEDYKTWNIYAHHGSGFDYIFILRHLLNLGKVDPLIKDGIFYNIKLSWDSEDPNSYINFRDSLLMLPSSLRKLSKAFGVEAKGFFPFDFVNNPLIPLNYIGKKPDYKFYEGMGIDEYKRMVTNSWNLRKISTYYCELDCKVLHQILCEFNKHIFGKFTLNVHKFPTLSSLALGIFRSGYIGDHKIPKVGGSIYDFIKQGYTGGRVDVFIPYGEDLYYYDVNSLYPTVYSSLPMPVGIPVWFSGNILEREPYAFGFFRCKITSPKDLKIPVLQTHVKTKNGIRTVAPLGTWEDVLFSEEARFAIKHGYKIEVIEGYTFDKEIVFDKYASDLFEIKSSHDSSHPMYLISKLLLNSLYGKFGMSIDLMENKIVEAQYLSEFIEKNNVINDIDLGNGKSIISTLKNREYSHDTTMMNVSIGIAVAITSYARIHMQEYLQSKGYKVYYTDTDSIVTDKPIDPSHIGKGLGKLKLEHKIKKGVFLAPKVYSILTESGKVITKIKGLKDSNVDVNILETLLYKGNTTTLSQEKSYKDFSKGEIEIRKTAYELKTTENKREFVYNGGNLAIDTKPFVINKSRQITKEDNLTPFQNK